MGEQYVAASGHIIDNIGQQTIQSYTDDYLPMQSKFQRTQVHRPLSAVSEMEDAGKTVVISKKYGRFIIDDVSGVRTEIGREGGTYYMDHWFFRGQV